MGTNECSQPASKSSWDSQDFGDISLVLKMAHFRKSTGPPWVKSSTLFSLVSLQVASSLPITITLVKRPNPIRWWFNP